MFGFGGRVKFYCIADKDTVRGFALAGVAGTAVADAKAAAEALARAAAQKECGVIIITESAASLIRAQVDAMRLEVSRPLIAEIPGGGGSAAKGTENTE